MTRLDNPSSITFGGAQTGAVGAKPIQVVSPASSGAVVTKTKAPPQKAAKPSAATKAAAPNGPAAKATPAGKSLAASYAKWDKILADESDSDAECAAGESDSDDDAAEAGAPESEEDIQAEAAEQVRGRAPRSLGRSSPCLGARTNSGPCRGRNTGRPPPLTLAPFDTKPTEPVTLTNAWAAVAGAARRGDGRPDAGAP